MRIESNPESDPTYPIREFPSGSSSLNQSAGNQFYEELPSFSDFEDLTDGDHYHPLPEDWWVFVTDVVDSSDAVQNGRYRDVNKLGAATVTTIQNILNEEQFPFTFGGDGATVALPESYRDSTAKNLSGLRKLAQENFGLDLRVGAVSVRELYEEGTRLDVAKYELIDGRSISFFRGEGVSLASDKIKNARAKYQVEAYPKKFLDLDNLSCRWNPIPNQRGTVLSILIKSRRDSENKKTVYDSVLHRLNQILEGGISNANPINTSRMSYRSFRQVLADEMRYQTSLFSLTFMGRFFEIILAVLVFRLGLNPGLVNARKYLRDTRTQSDYRTFDDMLRLTVDCSQEEREEIRTFLQSQRNDGNLFYGLHESDHTLMTCFVQNLESGGHLHFIDGAQGGYTQASTNLKKQMNQELQNESSNSTSESIPSKDGETKP